MECNKDGTLVLTGSTDGQAKLINTSTGKVRTSIQAKTSHIILSPCKMIVVGSMHFLCLKSLPFYNVVHYFGSPFLSNNIVKNQGVIMKSNSVQFYLYGAFKYGKLSQQLYRNNALCH